VSYNSKSLAFNGKNNGTEILWAFRLRNYFFKGKIYLHRPSIEGNPTCPIKLQDITKVDLVSVILESGGTYEFITKSK
jgi:hypothetical protein